MKRTIITLLLLVVSAPAVPQDGTGLMADLEKLVLRYRFESADPSLKPGSMDAEQLSAISDMDHEKLSRSVIGRIEKSPAASYALISGALGRPGVTEYQAAVYSWALGYTKSDRAADDIVRAYRENRGARASAVVEALDRIGTAKAKELLFGLLGGLGDDDRFAALSALARHKYAAALPEAGQYLKEDMNQSYWKMMIVFGKYGSDGVPYLMNAAGDADGRVRYNAVFLLGNVLLHPGIAPVVMKRYQEEKDAGTRKLYLTVAINLLHDRDAVFEFLKKAAETEKDRETAEMARKYAADREMIDKKIAEYRSAKKVNAKELLKVYDRSMESYGKECDFYAVSILSDAKDEEMLVRMRENFLMRNSDECLLDLNKMNLLILYNRFIADRK